MAHPKQRGSDLGVFWTYPCGYNPLLYSYVSIKAAHDPLLIPELMAYMYMIVRASQDFDDTVFRR